MTIRLSAAVLGLSAVLSAAVAPAPARADGWGTIKGKVIFAGDPPARATIDVNKDPKECLRNGPLQAEDYVVDKDTKGVRWCVVWLLDPGGDFKKDIPINPKLKNIPKGQEEVLLDQPCCMFEPHIICLREGQTLRVRNSGGVPHNTKIESVGDGPSLNPLLPPNPDKDPKMDVTVPNFVASPSPATVSCNIHAWMSGYVRTFKHPYFAVTDDKGEFTIKDAPAGKFNIVVWQEKTGYVTKNGKKGEPIEIKADGTTEVKYDLTPAK
jgi:hypothetical protein